MKIINAGKCWKMLENAGKKSSKDLYFNKIRKCWKMLEKIQKIRILDFFLLENAGKIQKTLFLDFFAGKCWKKIQNGIFFQHLS